MSEPIPNRAEHCFIWGDSGGGKTTVLRELHDRVDAPSVVVNHGYDGTPDSDVSDEFKGYIAAGPKRLRTIVGEYDEWEDVRIVYQSQSDDPLEAVATCVQFAREAPTACQLIIDEVDEVMPSDDSTASDNPTKWAFRKGRDSGIKAVGATQTPVGCDQNALRSAQWWALVGPASGYHEQFLNRHQWLPESEFPERDFQYVVWNKQGVVVYRGETKPRYA